MIQKKICLVGAPAVGKTSLVRRFVEGQFSDEYLTTIGVSISRRVVEADPPVSLVLWDINGDDAFSPIRAGYLRGAAGLLLVADGTRPATLDRALALHEDLGGETPAVLALNKRDLDWNVEPDAIEALRAAGWTLFETSAKSGDAVEAAFEALAAQAVS